MADQLNVPMTPVELNGAATEFAALTFPSLAPLLRDLQAPYFGWGLHDGRSTPAGLALGLSSGGRAQVLSLYVKQELRRAGLGVALLTAFERASASRGIEELWGEYAATLPQRHALEACLKKAGWDPPFVRESRLSGRIGDWLLARQQWPGTESGRDGRAGIALVPWQAEFATTAAAQSLEQERGFHPGLSLSRHAGAADLSTSIAILRRDRIVGWALAEKPMSHRDGALMIRWPTAYVTEELWKTGVLIRACLHSLALAGERYGLAVTAVFYAALPAIRVMANRRLSGVSSVIDIIEARKRICSNQATGCGL